MLPVRLCQAVGIVLCLMCPSIDDNISLAVPLRLFSVKEKEHKNTKWMRVFGIYVLFVASDPPLL